jgi:hypothetical protein
MINGWKWKQKIKKALDGWTSGISRSEIHYSKPLVTCRYVNPCYTIKQEGELI